MDFGRRMEKPRAEGISLYQSQHIVYLKVILDSKLSFTSADFIAIPCLEVQLSKNGITIALDYPISELCSTVSFNRVSAFDPFLTARLILRWTAFSVIWCRDLRLSQSVFVAKIGWPISNVTQAVNHAESCREKTRMASSESHNDNIKHSVVYSLDVDCLSPRLDCVVNDGYTVTVFLVNERDVLKARPDFFGAQSYCCLCRHT